MKTGHVLAKGGRYLKIAGLKREHDLVALARFLSFPISAAEEELLHRLTLYIPAGRYPIQRNWSVSLVPSPVAGMGKMPGTFWTTPNDDEALKGLLERLAKASE